jgi:hypothetical protein
LRRFLIILLIIIGCTEASPPDDKVVDIPQKEDLIPSPSQGGFDAGGTRLTDAGVSLPLLPGDTLSADVDGGTTLSLWPVVNDEDILVDAGANENSSSFSLRLGETRMRRLLSYQYQESIRSLLGEGAAQAIDLPVDIPAEDYRSIGAAQNSLDETQVNLFETNSFLAVQAAMSSESQFATEQTPWLWCIPISLVDTQCMTEIVYRFGQRVFRRPLTETEMLRWRFVAMQAVSEYQNYNLGIEFLIAGLLQSPYFLYVIEVGLPDAQNPEIRWLGPFEIATRLSYFLTAQPPSEALLEAAGNGELDSTLGIRVHAEALLQLPQAKMALRHFFNERYALNQLGATEKDDIIYPNFSEELRADMQEETLRFLEEVIWTENIDFRSILTAPFTFVNEDLANHYSLSHSFLSGDLVRHDFPDDSIRGGLLTQGSLLSIFATSRRTSPTLRGKFIREALLCQDISPPPPEVNTQLPVVADNEPHRTMRERISEHLDDVSCASCHASMDPLGLGLEHFDGIGNYRETDKGLTMDTTGVLFGQAFDGARSLGEVLSERHEVAICLVRHLFRHVTGHREVDDELDQLALLDYLFELDGYRLKDFLISMVTTTVFRSIGTAEGMTVEMTAESFHELDAGSVQGGF